MGHVLIVRLVKVVPALNTVQMFFLPSFPKKIQYNKYLHSIYFSIISTIISIIIHIASNLEGT
jgi:hypothetical protein